MTLGYRVPLLIAADADRNMGASAARRKEELKSAASTDSSGSTPEKGVKAAAEVKVLGEWLERATATAQAVRPVPP